jgi:predicted permease
MTSWLTQVGRRLRLVCRKQDVERELSEEVRVHVQMETADLQRRGWSPERARREALRRLGGIERTKEWVRDERGGRLLDDLVQDVRYSVRTLRRAPGFSATVILILALGIGANTALFSGAKGLLLDTIAVADADRLVRLRTAGEHYTSRWSYGYSTPETAAGETIGETFSLPTFDRLRMTNETLDGMFASAPTQSLAVIVGGQAEIATGFTASGSYFEMLGVRPRIGRAIGPGDNNLTTGLVVMISHPYWARRFGLDPDVVGLVISINNVVATIVGVLPPEYAGVQRVGETAADIHLPLGQYAELMGSGPPGRDSHRWVQIMGRLRPGVTPAQVLGNLDGPFQEAARAGMAAELEGMTPARQARARDRNRTAAPRLLVDSGRRGVYDPRPDVTRQVLILGVVVGLVLLIVCANVANLLLSRATTRRREIAVRQSVGATRARLVRQLVTEGVVLSMIGGGLGVLVAAVARQWLPFGQSAPFDMRLFMFVALLSLSTGVVFSLLPALRTTVDTTSGALKVGSLGMVRSPGVLGRGLLVVQVAVSVVLMVAAGLFLRTLGNLRGVDVGFNPSNVLLFTVAPELKGYDADRTMAVYDRIAERVRLVTGVRSVSLSQLALLTGAGGTRAVRVEGGDVVQPNANTVSADFFETMEIPLLAGRVFDLRDTSDAPQVVVVNEAAAWEYFKTDDAVGRRFRRTGQVAALVEVVGVVGDAKYLDVRADPPPTVYWPHTQVEGAGARVFEVRTVGPPSLLTTAVREAVRRVDPTLPLMNISTQSEQIADRLSQERLFAFAYSLFGGLAVVLASVGLFGLASHSVARRTNEIGIRMALGARAAQVSRMVLSESLTMVGLGVALGVAMALATGRLVASLLFELAPTDGLVLAQAVAAMVIAAAVAAFLPARRAARVDPLVAIRCD